MNIKFKNEELIQQRCNVSIEQAIKISGMLIQQCRNNGTYIPIEEIIKVFGMKYTHEQLELFAKTLINALDIMCGFQRLFKTKSPFATSLPQSWMNNGCMLVPGPNQKLYILGSQVLSEKRFLSELQHLTRLSYIKADSLMAKGQPYEVGTWVIVPKVTIDNPTNMDWKERFLNMDLYRNGYYC